jgi:hypothetical protein
MRVGGWRRRRRRRRRTLRRRGSVGRLPHPLSPGAGRA